MDWSYEHNRMMSVLERLLEPKVYVYYYVCCLRVKRRKRSGESNNSE